MSCYYLCRQRVTERFGRIRRRFQLSLPECAAVGVAVGLDASVANLSLAVSGYGLAAPIVFAVTHYFTVLLGQKLAGKIAMKHTNVLSAGVLMILAVSKFI